MSGQTAPLSLSVSLVVCAPNQKPHEKQNEKSKRDAKPKPNHTAQWHDNKKITGGRANDPEVNDNRASYYIEACEARARSNAYDIFKQAHPKSKLKYENFIHEGCKPPKLCQAGRNPTREFLLDSGASMHMVPFFVPVI